MKTILCTGGAGYIGSHTAIQLACSGKYRVIIVDNFANSSEALVTALKTLVPEGSVEMHRIDIATEPEKLNALKYDAVIHFAALKSVGDSVAMPLEYYRNNINCMINVLEAAKNCGAKHFVFSSSATVYKPSEGLLTEESPLGPSNPYGQTKLVGEMLLKDLCVSDPSWKVISLRYFNPIGAHESGLVGEDCSKAANIMPAIQRALFHGQKLKVFGDDWPTRDGTGVRDYIHVMDLADGHVLALDSLFSASGATGGAAGGGAAGGDHASGSAASGGSAGGFYKVYNLGSGSGVSVKELIDAFSKASGRKIDYEITSRRPGDLATVIADPKKAEVELGFKIKRDTQTACVDGWRWMFAHPNAYAPN